MVTFVIVLKLTFFDVGKVYNLVKKEENFVKECEDSIYFYGRLDLNVNKVAGIGYCLNYETI